MSSTIEPARARRLLRRFARYALEGIVLDKHELKSRRRVANISQTLDGAVLIGPPFSPVTVAADALARRGIPFIVDLGDPWVLTGTEPRRRLFGARRQRAAEKRLWAKATAGILTTPGQAAAVKALFPHLPILVRPNGYEPVPMPAIPARDPADRAKHLRIVHYGNFSSGTTSIRSVFERLVASDRWESVSVTQFGRDWDDSLASLPRDVSVQRRPPLPWNEAVAEARNFDVALVINARGEHILQSKAVQYLTLPIPRFGLSVGREGALFDYAADKPGYAVASIDDPDIAERLWTHLDRTWGAEDLTPPPGESWPAVARCIADFALHHLRSAAQPGDEITTPALEYR